MLRHGQQCLTRSSLVVEDNEREKDCEVSPLCQHGVSRPCSAELTRHDDPTPYQIVCNREDSIEWTGIKADVCIVAGNTADTLHYVHPSLERADLEQYKHRILNAVE